MADRRPRHRISSLLTWSMAGLVVAAVALVTVVDVVRLRRVYRAELETKADLVATTMNDILADALYFRQAERLRHFAEVIRAQPDIQKVSVFAPDGALLVDPTGAKYLAGRVGEETRARVIGNQERMLTWSSSRLTATSPILAGREVVGGIRLEFDTTGHHRQVRDTVVQHLWEAAAVALLGMGLAWLLARYLLRPVAQLTEVIDRIGEGQLDVELSEPRDDEIGRLVQAVAELRMRLKEQERRRSREERELLQQTNERLREEVIEKELAQQAGEESQRRLAKAIEELKRAQQTLIEQERLSALGHMATGIAHDMNNRIQVILGHCDILMTGDHPPSRDQVRRSLQAVRESALDAAGVVGRLRDYYRADDEDEPMHSIDLREVVERAVAVTEPRWKDQALRKGIRFEVDIDMEDVPWVEGNASELREALVNLIFNSLDAMPEGGVINFRGRERDGLVELEIRDTGIGMTDDVLRRALEPFFTTKGTGGSGLGLAVVSGTIQRHRGLLDIRSEPGAGATVSIRLRPSGRPAESGSQKALTLPPDDLSVLLVDDELAVRDVLVTILASEGFDCRVASSGQEAIEALRQHSFDLLVTDRAMPDMNGDELAAIVRHDHPTLPIIMLTGYGDLMVTDHELPAGVDLVLGKPITRERLLHALGEVSGRWSEVEPG